MTRIRKLKERIEQLKLDEQRAERKGNLERVAAIRYGDLRRRKRNWPICRRTGKVAAAAAC